MLEQLMLKAGVADSTLNVKQQPSGLDFYFANKANAMHLLDFLRSSVPLRAKLSKRLISQDDSNNTFNYKYTVYAEVAPICKDDLVYIEDKKLVGLLGGCSQLMLVQRVSQTITLVDPVSMRVVGVTNAQYWSHPFKATMSKMELTEYVVLDIERLDSKQKFSAAAVTDQRGFNKQSTFSDKICLAKAFISRASDMGQSDSLEVITHLGNVLQAGDSVLGYDLNNANLAESVKMSRGHVLPEAILVRKHYPDSKARQRKRKFTLKRMAKEEVMGKRDNTEHDQMELDEFMREIEEDPELRGKVNLYKRNQDVETQSMMDEEVELPEIDMDQLLDEMNAVDLTKNNHHQSLNGQIFEDEDDVEPEGLWDVGDSGHSNSNLSSKDRKKNQSRQQKKGR